MAPKLDVRAGARDPALCMSCREVYGGEQTGSWVVVRGGWGRQRPPKKSIQGRRRFFGRPPPSHKTIPCARQNTPSKPPQARKKQPTGPKEHEKARGCVWEDKTLQRMCIAPPQAHHRDGGVLGGQTPGRASWHPKENKRKQARTPPIFALRSILSSKRPRLSSKRPKSSSVLLPFPSACLLIEPICIQTKPHTYTHAHKPRHHSTCTHQSPPPPPCPCPPPFLFLLLRLLRHHSRRLLRCLLLLHHHVLRRDHHIDGRAVLQGKVLGRELRGQGMVHGIHHETDLVHGRVDVLDLQVTFHDL